MSQKSVPPVVSFVPDVTDLKINADYRRYWTVEYQWKTELSGWRTGKPFVFTLPVTTPDPTNAAFILAAARCPRGSIGLELTAVHLFSPVTNKPN